MRLQLFSQTRRAAAARAGGARLLRATLLGVLLIGSLLQIGGAWLELRDHGMDLQQDYIAAQRLLRGGDIFGSFSHQEVSALGVQAHLGIGMWRNVHPPLLVLLFTPLTLLSFAGAALLWTIASAAGFVALVVLIIRLVDLPLSRFWRWTIALSLLNWYPAWHHLHVGQVTILLFALMLAALLAWRRGAHTLAGILLALATLIKMFPGLLLCYLLLRRQWRVALAAAVTAPLVIGLQSLGDPTLWPRYFLEVAPANAADWRAAFGNGSLAGLTGRLFIGGNDAAALLPLPTIEPVARFMLCALALGWFGWILWQRRHTPPDHVGEYGFALCAMLLLSPITWPHAYIVLLLPIAYLIGLRLKNDAAVDRPIMLLLGLTVLGTAVPMDFIWQHFYAATYPAPTPGWINLLQPAPLVFIASYLALGIVLWRRQKQEDVRPATQPVSD